MSDIPALPSAIGIEAVECVAEGSGMTVRVTGRWRRRRPEWHGPAMLVIEAGDRRHRVPAMPEPPSLTGTLPGTWRISFSVPEELVEHLRGRTWLQLGAVMAPLSLAGLVDAASHGAPPRPPIDPELLAERQQLGYEFAAQSARRRAEEAEARASELHADIGRLQEELAEARREPERLKLEIAASERELRTVRQRLHAETEVRIDTEQQLAEREREIARLRERSRQLADRERELEHDLRRARRAVDEVQHQAVLARASTAVSEHEREDEREHQRELPVATSPPLAVEAALLAHAGKRQPPPRPTPPTPTPPSAALAIERTLVAPVTAQNLRELERERDRAQQALAREREAAREVIERERESARVALERARESAPDPQIPGLLAARENLARELATARLELSREREERRRAQERLIALGADLATQRERSKRALEAIVSFRRELKELGTAPETGPETAPDRAPEAAREPTPEAAPEPAPEAAPTAPHEDEVEPERLSAALERLREQHPPEEPTPPQLPHTTTRLAVAISPLQSAAATDAVPRLFRSLVRDEPATAGRLVLQLLPAQPLVHLRPVAYDLVLGPGHTLRVTSPGGHPRIELADGPRPPEQTQFRIEGDPPALARLLAAGPLHRLLHRRGRQTARLTGDAKAMQALRSLSNSPLSLRSLIAAGVQLEPALTFRLVAFTIDPNATAAERFSIAHRPAPGAPATATLHVLDGRPPAVTEPTLGQLEPEATTTLVCSPESLMAALLGDRPPSLAIEGDERPLGLLAHWLERA